MKVDFQNVIDRSFWKAHSTFSLIFDDLYIQMLWFCKKEELKIKIDCKIILTWQTSSEAQIRAKSWHVMGTGTRCGSGASIVTISSGNKWMLAEIGRHGVDTAKYETYHFWLFFFPLFPPLETRCPKLPSSSQSFPLSCVRFALSLTPSSSFFNLQS